jgi:anti-sigma B factor antagonist
MTINERLIQDVTFIHLGGRVTLTDGADLLRDTLQRLIAHGRTNLVLDFRDVPYIDSQAMAVIIRTHATLGRQGGGGLKLLQVTGHVRELLTVTGLSSVLEMFDTEADAVASFSPGGTARA